MGVTHKLELSIGILGLLTIVRGLFIARRGAATELRAGASSRGAIEGHQKQEVEENARELQRCVQVAHNKIKRELGLSSITVRVLGKFSDDFKTDVTIPPGAPKAAGSTTSIAKRIHFVRHGEGIHNVAQREWRASADYVKGTEPYTIDTDPEYRFLDAELTDKGVRQAQQLRGYVAKNCRSTELLIVSPMRRATRTGLYAFEPLGLHRSSVVAIEAAHERAGRHTCDKRLDKAELEKLFGDRVDYSLLASEHDPFFVKLGNGTVREPQMDVSMRAVDLLQFVLRRPEKEIAIAAHSALLQAVFSCVLEGSDIGQTWFGTGEIRSCDVFFNKA